ncbi:MAG: SDR family NAD(P)-dependent oxidoreductase [Cyanobacteria bacterium P01_A01_bin.123]
MMSESTGLEVAVIGISGRFPKSKGVESFWENLINGIELTSIFSDSDSEGIDSDKQLSKSVKTGAILDDIELFDASFFGFNPREAETMDPQHRLFLECAWEALENAGYNSEIEERLIGVYAGVGMGTYLLYNLSPNRNLIESRGFLPTLVGVDKDYLPTRVSYKLNLKGPSLSVGTACSSSLVAVHLACQSLLSGECDMALATGVAVKVPQSELTLSPGEIASPDGHCRAFDAKANGTTGGNGIGVVVLKRLEDAIADRDYIYAVIKGSAINNDGAVKVGYTAPSEEGQARAIRAAQIMAEVEPETITYIEAHGTGTTLGDPIEVAALKRAFRTSTDKKDYCALGSVKTNVGHLDAAAGIAGLIKTVLALDRKLLPPTLNFETPNPQIDFENSPFYVNTELSEWEANGTPRRAGVSSFGFGGTNAHVILEEAPVLEMPSASRAKQLILLSAKTSSALETMTANLATHLKHHPALNLADVAYTLQMGRQGFSHRRMILAEDVEDVLDALAADPQRVLNQFHELTERSVAFMFNGQGAQYVNMAQEIYQSEPVFRQMCDRCCDLLQPQLGLDLRKLLYPTDTGAEKAAQQLQQTAITQPALFVIEYALAQLWMSWGVHPVAMIGHSIGEYVAACLAGVFSLEDALALVTVRGQLMQQLPSGSMLAVPLSEKEVQPWLGKTLSLATINGTSSCVISGATEAIAALQNQLSSAGIGSRRLHTSHAFHSPMMEPILEAFQARFQQVNLTSPKIPYISNLTGTWITAQDATSPAYWTAHLRQTVRFAEGLQVLLNQPTQVLLEVGPGRTLSQLAKQHPAKQPEQVVLTSLRHPQEKQSDVAFLLNTLGQLWLTGVRVDWSGFYAHEQRHRLPLPTYPFERERYWIDPPKSATGAYESLPTTLWKALVQAGQHQATVGTAEFDEQAYLENRPSLESLCLAYMNRALRQLGAFAKDSQQYSIESLFEQFSISARYRQLLSHWLQVLVERGHLQQDGKRFSQLVPCSTDSIMDRLREVRVRWADKPKGIDLIERCGENLVSVLRGEKEPLELFQGLLYDFDEAEDDNLEFPWHTYYNSILRAIAQQVVDSLPRSTHLRVLEIGGGQGLATRELLPVLPSDRTNYTFTDVGAAALNRCKKQFSDYPFIDYRFLDIERPPTEQGYESHSFDLVVAVNVLHVTKSMAETLQHVRSLLAPNGLLLMWEITEAALDFDITWGLLMNPLEDEERSRGNPFLAKQQWQEALLRHGFVEVEAFPEMDTLGQHILVAQASMLATLTAPAAFTTTLEPKDAEQTPPVSFGKRPDMAEWFYLPSWKRSMPPSLLQSQRQATEPECWLVFVDEWALGGQILKRLEYEGHDVITVRVGTQFSSNEHLAQGQRGYTINPQQSGDYETLLQDLLAHQLRPTKILHLWNVVSQRSPASGLEATNLTQEKGFYSLLFLVQALEKQNLTDELQIAVISNDMQPVTGKETLSPEKATLLGAVRAIPLEYPHICCRSIDILLPEDGSWQEEMLLETLWAELKANPSDDVIAYRDLHRWVPALEPVRLTEAFEGTSRLRQAGVYLITGGLGTIGLTLASYLTKAVRAKLILTGRSAFPAKDKWDEWLSSHDRDDDVSHKIGQLKALEKLGAEVFIAQVDVANLESMQPVIAQAQEQFGSINGVIHAAGVLGEGLIGLKTREDVESVFAPKVGGTRVLDTIFKDSELDFIVLCSSGTAVTPISGQISYSAANNFLDAFAHYKTAADGTPVISLNWATWQGSGMAVEAAKKLVQTRSIAQPQSRSVNHPLFDRVLVEGLDETYTSNLSARKYWVLDEHRVRGQATLPGTAYLEMVLAAGESHSRKKTLEIQDMTFLTPLVLEEDQEKAVRTCLHKWGDGFEFRIVSQSHPESEDWIEHATGKISFTESTVLEKHNLQEIEASFQPGDVMPAKQQYGPPTELLALGERWRCVERVKLGKNRGFAVLELPEAFRDDLNAYKLHPSLFDCALGFPILKLQADSFYLPFSYKKLRINGALPSKVHSYVTTVENFQPQAETLSFNITIIDDQGTELVKVEDYTLRRLDLGKGDFGKGDLGDPDAITAPLSAPQNGAASLAEDSIPSSENFYLDISSPGSLDTLTFRSDTRKKPGPGEVEIEVSVTGLNFKEVLFASGLMPPAAPGFKFGLECAGQIVAVGEAVKDFAIGDEVMAFGSSCFSRFITTPARLVAPKPAHLSMQEAATMPISFTTAYHALIKLGQLSKGEKVLIHAATGGVGMAAVQIAQWVGAEIFATAGNPEKRQFLHSLGIEHVMDSRSVAFADEVMQQTRGSGVDVVLNSLGGEFVPKGLLVLARYGRFLELGLRDILNHSQLDLGAFEKRLSFFAIQVDPELPNFNALWRELVHHFQASDFAPLPHKAFPITAVAEAFKYMAEAKHIGKIVVSLEDKAAIRNLVLAKPGVSQHAREALPSPAVRSRQPSSRASIRSNAFKEPMTTSEFQVDFLKDGLLPSEGIEVFKRVLGSAVPQILVSTTDLLAGTHHQLMGHILTSPEVIDQPKRGVLAPPTHARPPVNNDYVAPKNEVEKKLATIWQEVLGIKQVGIGDNFFELGGDSLLIVQVRSKLQETFKKDFSTTDLFQYPTISDLTKYISQEVEQPTFQQAHTRAKRQQDAMAEELQLMRRRRKGRG